MMNWTATCLVVALGGALVGCAVDSSGAPGPTLADGKSDGYYWARSVMRKDIDPVPVPDDGVIGGSLAALVAAETAGATLVSRDDSGPCVVERWAREEGALELRDCDPSFTDWGDLLRIRHGAGWGWDAVFTDFDTDGQIDGHLDHTDASRSAYDDDRDGRIDRLIEAVANLEGFVVTGYAEGWIPPSRLANRILEDTDFDGFFDRESVTGFDNWWCEEAPDSVCAVPSE